MDKELKEAKTEAMARHLERVEKTHAFKTTYKTEDIFDYIDIYTLLLDEISNYYLLFVETKKRRYLNLIKKSQELLTETAREAVLDV